MVAPDFNKESDFVSRKHIKNSNALRNINIAMDEFRPGCGGGVDWMSRYSFVANIITL